jgi:hypothetical protein
MTPTRRYPLILALLADLVPAAFPARTCYGILLGICFSLIASLVPVITVAGISLNPMVVAPWQWLACGLLVARLCVACRRRPHGPLADTVGVTIEMISRGTLSQPVRRVFRRRLIDALFQRVFNETTHHTESRR